MINKCVKSQLTIAIICCFVVSIFVMSIPLNDNIYHLLVLINAEIACLELFMFYKQPFSLHKVTNFFILTFFIVANSIQYSSNYVASTINIQLKSEDYIFFQLWVMGILILFNTIYPLYNPRPSIINLKSRAIFNINIKLLIAISFIAMLIVIYNFRTTPLQLIIRFDDYVFVDEKPDDSASFQSLVFSKLIRTLPLICYLIAKNYGASKKNLIILFLFMLVSIFPTSLARNAVAMYWLPVLFYNVSFLKNKNVFILVLLLGIIFFFPFLNNFRDYNIGNDIDLGFDISYMNSLNFDASHEFMIAMHDGIITYGYQLLGVLLFWFPRSLWPGKPVGSGEHLANMHLDAFPNISMPYWGEGYMNFGYVGIILFTIILSILCKYFDSKYWDSSILEHKEITPFYYVLLGAMTFILRGDLLSSVAYTFAILFDLYLIKKIVMKTDFSLEKRYG